MDFDLTCHPHVLQSVVEKGMVMQYVDHSTSQHWHRARGRNADCSQDVNRSPDFGWGIVTPT